MPQVQASTDLFKSHKAAQLVASTSSFQALQSSTGKSLFFGVSDTNILHLSAEQDHLSTGWQLIDLTTELGSQFPGQTVTAKHFSVGQSLESGDISIVQVVHVAEANTDALFALLDLPNDSSAAWLQSPANRQWISRPYPGGQPLDLAYVKMPVSDDPKQKHQAIAGVRDSGTGFIKNHLVNLAASGGGWTTFENAVDFDNLQDLNIGKPQGALFPGVYQLTTLSGSPTLTFTPWRGVFGPPDVTALTAPAGATSIAVTPTGEEGSTDLYIAAEGAIYLFAANNQGTNSTGVQVISDPLIAGVTSVNAHVANSKLTVWGRTNGGAVFYSRCDLGRQSNAQAWSKPIPIQQGVDQIATLLDLKTGSSVLFTHAPGAQISKLTQDPVTTIWRTRSILLPSLNINDVIPFYSYTTHISILDENNLPTPNETFSLTATSPVTLYLDDVYVTLSPSNPVPVTSDAQGTFTLVQETRTLGAVCYKIAGADGSATEVNPMNTCIGRMSKVQTGEQLRAVRVTDEKGTTSRLVSKDVPDANSDAVAQGIHQFVKTSAKLPQNGSVQTTPPSARRTFDATQDTTWGMKFTWTGKLSGNSVGYYEGPEQMAALGLGYSADGVVSLHSERVQLGDVFGGIEAFAGDIFSWLWDKIEDLTQFFVKVIDGVTHFFLEIAGDLYRFVLRCINDVAHAIEVVFKAIEVGFEKLVEWIGFIFEWNDILRTHRALKNIFIQFTSQCVTDFPNYKEKLKDLFANVQNSFDGWIAPDTGSAASIAKANPQPTAASSPQAHYGAYQLKHNGAAITTTFNPADNTGKAASLLADLQNVFSNEEKLFVTAYEQLKDVFDNPKQLTAKVIFETLIEVVFNVIWGSVENLTLATVDLLGALLDGVTASLNAPLDIPVLSWLYSAITHGSQLGFLDLICLVAAIPVTFIMKIVTNETPFPDNQFSHNVIHAGSFADLRQAFQSRSLAPGAALGSTGFSKQDEYFLSSLGGSIAGIGAILVIITSIFKYGGPEYVFPYVLYALAYLPYIAPNITGQIIDPSPKDGYVYASTAIAGVSTIKNFVEIGYARNRIAEEGWKRVSAWVEFGINLSWEGPTVAAIVYNHDTAQDAIGFVANTLFNAGGVLAPGTKIPEVFGVSLLLAGLYGVLMLTNSIIDLKEANSTPPRLNAAGT
jgi:hypothetical protein